MPPGSTSVDVTEVPDDAVNVGDEELLDGRIGLEIEGREDGVRAVSRDGESSPVIGVGSREDLRERDDLLLAAALLFLFEESPESRRGRMRMRMRGKELIVRHGVKREVSEDLVGDRIREEADRGDDAGDRRSRDGGGGGDG